ncbi:hypothetical protein BDV26DRAFT_278678 [Aspergillus bertholletiae]|uniref:mRNA stability protein n=1 Tax=Aspergillus bertholletiae TaxID=1226010 RepID=A0A5N7BIA3_9EURO|nr:hypothetical protein BDV26DRAFT_278678 [Aspergillus bertholletiae]
MALTGDEQCCLRVYGRLPHGELLRQQSRERRYFDSGDLAPSAADKVTADGPIQTGTAHATRDSISRPYAPVPNISNANKDANRDVSGKGCQIAEMIDSPLHQQINSANGMQKPEGTI